MQAGACGVYEGDRVLLGPKGRSNRHFSMSVGILCICVHIFETCDVG